MALVERADRRRAKPPGARRGLPEHSKPRPALHPLALDPDELATFLLSAPLPGGGRATPPEPAHADEFFQRAQRRAALHVVSQPTLEVLNVRAPQLDPDERRLLADAIDDQRPVRIDYVDGEGKFSSRVIEEIELSGTVIEAWCRLREDERMFMLDRIDAVSPA